MVGRLAARRIVVTGSGGISAATARWCVREGAAVHVVTRDELSARELAEAVPGVTWSLADLSLDSDSHAAFDEAEAVLGRIDGLVAVAGGSARRMGDGPVDQLSTAGLNATVALNLATTTNALREFTARWLARDAGNAGGTDAAGRDAAGTDAAATDPAATDPAATDPAGTDAAGTDAAGRDAAATDSAGTDAAGTRTADADVASPDAAEPLATPRSPWASAVLIGSSLGRFPASPLFVTHGYAATKAAIEGLARSAAAHYSRDRLTVNVVAPGLTKTPMASRAQEDEAISAYARRRQPLTDDGFLAAEDIADACGWMLGARTVTGQVIYVDGGWSVYGG